MNKVNVIKEVTQNFLDSSWDVNCNRAFPDARDGLKRGQRACVWEMYKKGYKSSKPHVKSAKIDGGVAANWWPHGTTAIYETFARMSQPFINNVCEVDFHGNNGNIIIGPELAADRYTEARLSKIVEEGMLANVEKETVPMQLNFSEDAEWPTVLPAVFPRLLVNGSQGIGVGIATTCLPHNFQETADLILKYLATGELDEDNYYPDFPTGGVIINQSDLPTINKTGKGKCIVEAKYSIKNKTISFTELPYQVYVEPILDKIKELVEKGDLEGITGVFNKSDKKGLCLTVECSEDPAAVVEKLFALTPLRSQYNANQNAIVSKTPILMNLRQLVDVYIEHNLECIKNENIYDLKKAQERINILEGLCKALEDIDNIIAEIRASKTAADAKERLMAKWNFNDAQASAILAMKLSKLANLEAVEIQNELKQKIIEADECQAIIQDKVQQKHILEKRLAELSKKFGTPRRTPVTQKTIVKASKGKQAVEQIPENIAVVLTENGYLKNIPIKSYRSIYTDKCTIKTTTVDIVYLFSSIGKVYRIQGKDIPFCDVKDKGTVANEIVKLAAGEKIILATGGGDFDILSVSNLGQLKRSKFSEYAGTTRSLSGIAATKIKDGQSLLNMMILNKDEDICLLSKNHNAIRFQEKELSCQGKTAQGVKGIDLAPGDEIIECVLVKSSAEKVPFKYKEVKIKTQKRGGKGKNI